jgi:ABC-type multidrug transport system fused ATPase/permease subunit
MSSYEDQEEKKQSFDIKVWLKLKSFVTPYKNKIIGVILLMMLMALIDIIFPLFQSYIVDNLIEKGTLNGIRVFTGLYFTALLIQVISVFGFTKLSMRVEMKMSYDLKKAVFNKLQTLSLSYYNQNPVGHLISRVLSDTGKIGDMIAWGITDLFWSAVYVIGVFVVMFILNYKLALLVLLIIPIMAIATVYFQGKLLSANRSIRKTNAIMTGDFNEGITGAKTSKTLVIEDKNLLEFKQTTNKLYNSSIKMAKLNAVFIPIIIFAGTLASAIVLEKGGNLALVGKFEIGKLSAFLAYALGIFEPIRQLASIFAEFISLQANIERVSDLLEQKPLITDTEEVIAKYGDNFEPKRENWEDIKGEIEFKDVTFKYPDGNEEVLKNFSLKIPAGTNIAIVGETGAGKSTLVNLACRFFEPTSGQILIDGVDYKQRSQLWLHSNIGYVLQTPHLFSGSVKENIRYGKLDATDEEIERAAKSVSADKVVAKLDKGYDSDVGENGDNLSTGEKQLVSFARAIIADPKIFVLDEATSSIDTQTEQLIQDAINNILNERTSFIIAHRLSTIKTADLILVVKDGKIIEQGNHKELIRAKGHYYDLYTKQFEEEKTNEVLK